MNSFPDTNSSTISCVVLNWNGGSDTVACIRSLLSSRDVALDIVVIDNGSMDRSVELLEEQFLTLTILKHQSNIGVAGGFNLGIDWAIAKGHSLVFFINNDATVERDCLLVLKQVLDTNNRRDRFAENSRPQQTRHDVVRWREIQLRRRPRPCWNVVIVRPEGRRKGTRVCFGLRDDGSSRGFRRRREVRRTLLCLFGRCRILSAGLRTWLEDSSRPGGHCDTCSLLRSKEEQGEMVQGLLRDKEQASSFEETSNGFEMGVIPRLLWSSVCCSAFCSLSPAR